MSLVSASPTDRPADTGVMLTHLDVRSRVKPFVEPCVEARVFASQLRVVSRFLVLAAAAVALVGVVLATIFQSGWGVVAVSVAVGIAASPLLMRAVVDRTVSGTDTVIDAAGISGVDRDGVWDVALWHSVESVSVRTRESLTSLPGRDELRVSPSMVDGWDVEERAAYELRVPVWIDGLEVTRRDGTVALFDVGSNAGVRAAMSAFARWKAESSIAETVF